MVEGLDGLNKVGGGTNRAGDDDVPDGPIGAAPIEGAAACEWCGDVPAGAGYFVAAREERFSVCPECWGRAPEYLDLRRDGWDHAGAVRRLCGRSGRDSRGGQAGRDG